MAFYIVKKSIFLHGVWGPYESEEDARLAFQIEHNKMRAKAIRGLYNDFDGHHDYIIVEGLGEFDGKQQDFKGETIEYEALK